MALDLAKYDGDKQRDILRRSNIPDVECNMPEWGWSNWTPIIVKLLDRIEALENGRQIGENHVVD